MMVNDFIAIFMVVNDAYWKVPLRAYGWLSWHHLSISTPGVASSGPQWKSGKKSGMMPNLNEVNDEVKH